MKYLLVLLIWITIGGLVFLISGFVSGTFDMALMEEEIKFVCVMFGTLAALILSGMVLEKS